MAQVNSRAVLNYLDKLSNLFCQPILSTYFVNLFYQPILLRNNRMPLELVCNRPQDDSIISSDVFFIYRAFYKIVNQFSDY